MIGRIGLVDRLETRARASHAPCAASKTCRLVPRRQETLTPARASPSSEPSVSTTAVAVEDLRLSRGGVSVLNGTNLKVKTGSLHMLLGPNGCGKSTLLKALGGLLTPSSGKMDAASPTGFVFQNPDHQVVMPTVAADVAFGLGRYTMEESEVEDIVRTSLELVNMTDCMYRAAHTLSGGQRQRVAIAGGAWIAHSSSGVTAIWVTHRFEEMEYADAVSYMQGGKIEFTGSPEEMRAFLRRKGAPV
eukprot:gene7672-830_t